MGNFDWEAFIDNLWNRENAIGKKAIEGKGGYHNGLYFPYKTPNGNTDIGPGLDLDEQDDAFKARAKKGFTRQELDSIVKSRLQNERKFFNERITKEGGDTTNLTDNIYAGLLDMQWQLGNGLYHKYPKFWEAVAKHDYDGMQKESRTGYYEAGKSEKPEYWHWDDGRWEYRKNTYFNPKKETRRPTTAYTRTPAQTITRQIDGMVFPTMPSSQPAITKQDVVDAVMLGSKAVATGVGTVANYINQAVQKYVKPKNTSENKTVRWAEGGYLKPKDAWDALSMKDKADMIGIAVKHGITTLSDIRDKYNEFAKGGDTDPLEYTHQRFPVTKEFDITPYKDPSFTPDGMGNIEYMSAKHDTLPYYNNYQKPDSLKGKSVVVYNDRMGDAANEAIALDILSHGLREQDPTWRRKYLPTLTDAFEGDAIYNMTDKDRKIYNLNDPEDRGEVIDNYIDDYIRAMAVDDKYRKALNYAPRSILNKEYNTLPPEQQNALAEAYSYIYPTRLPDVTVYGKKHSIGGPLVEGVINEYKDGGDIYIKPSHRGRLTELKKRTGKTEAELYRTGSPATRKMITFARSARKWKHGNGGNLFLIGGPEEKGRGEVTNLSAWDELAAQSPLFYTIGKAIDPTGISGYGDAREAINQYDSSPSLSNGYTAVMETLGALPIVSKAGKAIKFLQGAITGQGVFDDYNYAQEKKKEYGDELVVDYWDNTVKPRREAERHGEQMKSKMAYTDVHHVPSFKLAPKGSKSGQIISDYDINHRVVKKYKKVIPQ